MPRHRNPFSRIILPIASLALASTCAHAAIIVTPTGATSTTTIGGTRTITSAINGVGLSSGGMSSNILTETHDGGNINSHWLSDSGIIDDTVNSRSTTETLTFNLGGMYDLNAIYVWGYNRPERARAVRTFDIAFSTDGGATFSSPVSASSLGMSDFTIGTTSGGERSDVQTRAISLQADVTHVQFTNIANFGATDRLALAEIRFGAIPEPTTALLGGLGFLALLRRRR